MADVSDSLGRFIQGQSIANLTLSEIKGLLKEGLNKPVGAAKPVGKTTSKDPAIDKITELFQKFSNSFGKDVDEQKKYLNEMIKVLNDKKEKKSDKEEKKSPKEEKVTSLMEKFTQAGLKKGSIYTHDTHVCLILDDIRNVLGDIAKQMGVTIKVPPAPPTPTPTPAPPADTGGSGFKTEKDMEDAIKTGAMLEKLEQKKAKAQEDADKAHRKHLVIRARLISDTLQDVSSSLLGIEEPLKKMFDGVISKERKVIQDTRAISYEIEGATKNSYGLNRSFENLGKTVQLTGADREELF